MSDRGRYGRMWFVGMGLYQTAEISAIFGLMNDALLQGYREFGDYLHRLFPHYKVQKITLNAGFTCPNRDGLKGRGGCTYCNNQTFSPAYALSDRSVTEQLREGIAFFSRKYPQMKYLAYFQAYTNTYGEQEEIIRKYEEALAFPEVVGLVIGTRPDCMPEALLSYLKELSGSTFVLVEYGVESTLNSTLERVNRGHLWEESVEAIVRTADAGLPVGAHLILGLPWESRDEILGHADKLSALPITTLKLHQLQIIRETAMGRDYLADPSAFQFYTETEYVDLCLDFIERLRPDIILERFVSQSPAEWVLMPRWGMKNHEFTHLVRRRIQERDIRQGRYWQGCMNSHPLPKSI